MECLICLEENNVTSIKGDCNRCNRLYHIECYKKLEDMNMRCPICRDYIIHDQNRDIYTNYIYEEPNFFQKITDKISFLLLGSLENENPENFTIMKVLMYIILAYVFFIFIGVPNIVIQFGFIKLYRSIYNYINRWISL